ncbi:MAG: T9SS type A sorting domain-containing protein [Bacteroidota bacterium]
MKLWTTLLFTFWMLVQLSAQGWEQVYETPNGGFRYLIEAHDGGYIIGAEDAMVRTDALGNELWTQDNEAEVITRTSDDAYVTAVSQGNGLFITKINPQGFLAWTKGFDNTNNYSPLTILELPNEELVVSATGSGQLHLYKTDKFGAEVWRQSYPGFAYAYTTGTHLVATDDGGFVFCGSSSDVLSGQMALRKVDAMGEIVWTKALVADINDDFEQVRTVAITSEGGFLVIGVRQEGQQTITQSVLKYDANGELLWERVIEETEIPFASLQLNLTKAYHGYELLELENGDIIATRAIFRSITISNQWIDYGLIQLNSDGDINWIRDYLDFSANAIAGGILSIDATGELLIGGRVNFDLFLTKMDGLGNIYSNLVTGNVFHDLNANCSKDFGEDGLGEWIVEVEGEETSYAITDIEGNYSFGLASGDYDIRLILKGPYWESCQEEINFSLSEYDTLNIDFPMVSNIDCPYLEVDISTPFLRRCFENRYVVEYCNWGTEPAIAPYIEVDLDPYLIVNGTSEPFEIVDGLYLFEVEDLPVGSCGSFSIDVTVDCDSTVLGQTHCVEAHIYPDSLCLPLNPNWSGASIELDANCIDEMVEFTITNVGAGDMSEELHYIVIEDDIIMYQDTEVALVSGGSTTISFPANGSTYRLEVVPITGHPGENFPSIGIEGCTPESSTNFSLGFLINYPENDNDPFVSIDCQQNIGSYDPNDKAGFPRGYGDEFFIEANTDIEYKIRFQNTGTDTAFTVRIVDEIDPALDIASIRPGASSHPYELLIEDGALQFIFENIMLPDSNINEVASHGFVKFRIAQQPDNPLGTQIYNKAGIYFDFNLPIITNETLHTIGEDYIATIVSTSSPEAGRAIQVAPNPFRTHTWLTWEGEPVVAGQFRLFDLSGQLLRVESFSGRQFQLLSKGLTPGIYFYEIDENNRTMGRGKIVVQ